MQRTAVTLLALALCALPTAAQGGKRNKPLADHPQPVGASGIAWFTNLWVFFAYNLAARLGNTSVWYIFDYWLHHSSLYTRWTALPLPRPIRAVWISLLGANNLLGTIHHYLHHRYPAVPDDRLPALAKTIGDQPGANATGSGLNDAIRVSG